MYVADNIHCTYLFIACVFADGVYPASRCGTPYPTINNLVVLQAVAFISSSTLTQHYCGAHQSILYPSSAAVQRIIFPSAW